MRGSEDQSGLTSVDGVGDIDVVGQRDILDLNTGLSALFFKSPACNFHIPLLVIPSFPLSFM
jgi:hypothetical protein